MVNDTVKNCITCKHLGPAGRAVECSPCDEHSHWQPVQVATVKSNDPVNYPKHYTNHPSGIECIQITEHMGFNLGNAIKYIWRADLKADAIEDMKKAVWYIQREIAKRDNNV